MTTTAINLPLYRVLRALNVSEPEAEAAAEAALPDLSQLATKEELRAEIAGVRTEIAGVRADLKVEASTLRTEISGLRTEIAQTVQRQTTWLITAVVAATGIIIATQRIAPPALPTDAVRAVVEQTVRNLQPQLPPATQPSRPVPPP